METNSTLYIASWLQLEKNHSKSFPPHLHSPAWGRALKRRHTKANFITRFITGLWDPTFIWKQWCTTLKVCCRSVIVTKKNAEWERNVLSEKKKGKWGVANQVYLHLSGNLMSPCILLSWLPPTLDGRSINYQSKNTSHCIAFELFQQRQGKSRAGFVQREGMWSVSWHNGWVPALPEGAGVALALAPGKGPGQCHSVQVLLQHAGKAGGSWKSWTQIPVFLCLELLLVKMQLPAEISFLGHLCSSISQP